MLQHERNRREDREANYMLENYVADLDLLRLMMNREYFTKYSKLIKKELICRETNVLLQDFEAFYNKFIDIEEIRAELESFITFFFYLRHPEMLLNERALYNRLFNNLREETTICAEELLKKLKAQSLGYQLQEAIENDPDDRKYTEILDKYFKQEKQNQLEFVEMDLSKALEKTNPNVGYSWRLLELNDVLGRIAPATFGIIAARTDSGKSSFLVSEMTYIAQQLGDGEDILWLNNENKGVRIVPRLYCAMLGRNRDEIEEKLDKAKQVFETKGGNKIKIMDIQQQSYKFIEQIVKQLRPKIVIIDMLDNVRGFSYNKNETVDAKYDLLYQWALELSCLYDCCVIGTSQMNKEGAGQRYPDMTVLKGSTTAKQSAASWLLMIGKDDSPNFNGIRFFSAPKSKFSNEPYRFEANFDSQRALFYTNKSPIRYYNGE